jgi:hypothetical protein
MLAEINRTIDPKDAGDDGETADSKDDSHLNLLSQRLLQDIDDSEWEQKGCQIKHKVNDTESNVPCV